MDLRSDPIFLGSDLRVVSAGLRERRERRTQHQGRHRTAFMSRREISRNTGCFLVPEDNARGWDPGLRKRSSQYLPARMPQLHRRPSVDISSSSHVSQPASRGGKRRPRPHSSGH